MPMHYRPSFSRPSLSFVVFCALLATLWIAGGASRADALGQVVVRGAAWLLLIVAALFGERPSPAGARPIFVLLAAATGLALVQLVPLPPAIWQALPGRAALAEAATISDQAQPWRCWSIVPSATFNAASSLIVPLATLLFLVGLNEAERSWLPGLILALITTSSFVGLLQFSGAGFNNPLINDTIGQPSGTFANRNHLALFLAIGCLLAPLWAFSGERRAGWRGPVSFGLVLLFVLVIVAIGSRAGLLLGALALALGLLLVRHDIRRELNRAPRWVFPLLIAALLGVIGLFVLLSIAADRADTINRALSLNPGEDLRRRGLPTVLAMIRMYFPMGSGLGGFDPIFRMHEPFNLLQPTYFNHAHNDLLEVVLDAGLPGLGLLLGSLGWWAVASVRAWSGGDGVRHALPKLGSAIILLIVVASAFDYPARTPMMMAIIVVAAVWLAGAAPRAALPLKNQHL